MKKFIICLLSALLLVVSAYAFVSISGAINKVNTEGIEIEFQPGVIVKYIKIVTPKIDNSEDRAYFVTYNLISEGKLYPVRFDLIHENWKLETRDNKEVYVIHQLILILDTEGNLQRASKQVLVIVKDTSELVSQDAAALDQEEAVEILIKDLDLLLNHSGRV